MPGLKLGKEAQAKFNEAKSNPDRAGALEKKGAKRKNWNERWFVLKDNYLFYCKNEKSNPQGIINLHGCTVSAIQGPTARPHSFSLLAPKSVSIDAKWTNRTYFMAARDIKEMELWMTKLDENGRQAVERAAQKKADQAKANNGGTSSPTQASPQTAAPVQSENKKVEEVKVNKTSESDNDLSSEDEKPVPKKVDSPPPVRKEEPKEEEKKEEAKEKKHKKSKSGKEKKDKKKEEGEER